MEAEHMPEVQETYAAALDNLVAKLQTDSYVVAAVLVGSLAYDTVWERSDIDLIVVTEETRQTTEGVSLVELGVNIHASLVTRNQFRKLLEGSAQGSFIHSMLGKGQILFSRDEPLNELFAARHELGDRDRRAQLLRVGTRVLPALTKAEKWFHAKKDYDYCFLWIMKCVDGLASIEMLLHGEVPSREVIQRALTLNPDLFRCLYTDLIHGDPDAAQLETALTKINTYFRSNAEAIFGLVLDYLREQGEVRSSTDINHYFVRQMNIEGADMACEWLADEGYLDKFAAPVRITAKSRVDLEEAAYYFPGDQETCP